MNYAIIGSGNIGQALAREFARHGMEVNLANSRGAESLQDLVTGLGPLVIATELKDAVTADIVFLAIPFLAHTTVAAELSDWKDKIIVDAMNTLNLSPEQHKELGGELSSEVAARAFRGASLVKGFNHLPAKQLGTNPEISGQRQVIFLAGNHPAANGTVAKAAEQLGFAPVLLGTLREGGAPLHVIDGKPGGLLFQNLAKLS